MNPDTLQQLVRIILYVIGGWALGDTVTQGPEFQNMVAGALSVVGFVWWIFWEKGHDHVDKLE